MARQVWPMHPTAVAFVEAAERRYGLTPEVQEFDEGTKTAADAADAIGCEVAQIASSIVMKSEGHRPSGNRTESDETDGAVVVVVTSGANRADEDRVAAELGAESVRMADPDEAKDATGWSIGGVPPICHETDVPVLFDESLLAFEEVWAAAGTPQSVWPIDPERLVELAEARPIDVTG